MTDVIRNDNHTNKTLGNTGAMVAFFPPVTLATALFERCAGAIDGGNAAAMQDPDDMHVTLAYLGDAAPLDDQKAAVIDALRAFAASEPPLDGKFNGIGRFMDSDPSAFYANFDSPALPAFRQRLLDALQAVGVAPDPTHGYTPHLTLAYLPQDVTTPPVDMQPIPFTVDHLALAWGDERYELPLAGQPIKSLDRPIAFGSAIKSLGNGRVGGYLVAYGGKDLEGEYFTPETEFCLDWYPQRPVLYHHGFDETLKATAIGIIDTIKADDVGLWAEAQLDLHNQYLEAVQALIDKGVLGWSSGALPQGVDKDYDGRIKCWPLIEGSLTPTPAEFQRTRVTTLKAYLASLEESSGTAKAGDAGQDAAGDTQPQLESQSQTTEKGMKSMDEQMMAALISAVAEALGMQLNEEDLARLTEQVKPIYAQYEQQETAKADGEEAANPEEDMAQKAIHDPTFLQSVAAVVRGINKPTPQAIKDAVKATIAGTPGQSKIKGFKAPNNGGRPQITGMLDQRYDHLKAHEAALAVELMRSMKKQPSEDLLRAAAYKTAQQVERGDAAATDLAVKSVFSFTKANEVMQSTLTGYGDEWAGVFWNTQQWLAVRQETPIYQRMVALGMEEREIPRGYEKETVPLESTDPTWYVAAGATAEDSNTGLPTPTVNSTKYGTGQKDITLAKLSARLDYQKELEEDSIVEIAPDANRKLTVSSQEQIEYILLCGDTATAGSTNINLIDGTPAAAPAKPSYTLLDGILKLALVTNTANSRDAGATLTEADYLALLPMLGTDGKLAADLDRIMFVVDNSTYFASLTIAALKTKDVFTNATIEEGVLTRIWGVELLRSGQMGKANSAGKVSATPGNNTLGRIALIRPDQWTARWKRKLDMFTTYYPGADVTQVVAHMRWGLAYRDNEAAAVSYNVPVTIS